MATKEIGFPLQTVVSEAVAMILGITFFSRPETASTNALELPGPAKEMFLKPIETSVFVQGSVKSIVENLGFPLVAAS
jgi:hypothetical protein